MLKDAIIDQSGKYRYSLERCWGSDISNVVNFILLNPSTADATRDDPTVKACIAFAKGWGFDALIITNLFAYRVTQPSEMKVCNDPYGSENEAYLKQIAKKSKKVVIAWGNHGSHCDRDKEVLKMLSPIQKLYCLGITKIGHPKHPLYVSRDTEPIVYPI